MLVVLEQTQLFLLLCCLSYGHRVVLLHCLFVEVMKLQQGARATFKRLVTLLSVISY